MFSQTFIPLPLSPYTYIYIYIYIFNILKETASHTVLVIVFKIPFEHTRGMTWEISDNKEIPRHVVRSAYLQN